MFKKIKLGTSILALIMFAFPWLNIQCSEKSLGTQTGIQMIYGGASPSEGMEELWGDAETETPKNNEESLGFASLIGLALLVVLAALVFSFIALFKGDARADRLGSILPAVALVLLMIQLLIGFPAKRKILGDMSEKNRSQETAPGIFEALGESMLPNIQAKTTPFFYIELLMLGIPTLLLFNGVVDKYKKD